MSEREFQSFFKQSTKEQNESLMLEFILANVETNHFLAKETKKFLKSEIKKRESIIAKQPNGYYVNM